MMARKPLVCCCSVSIKEVIPVSWKVRLAQCAGFSELVDCGTMVAVADDDRLASLDELACAVQTNAAGGTGNKNGERGGQTDTSVVSGLPIVVWLVRLPSSLIQINIFSCYLLYRRLPPWGLRGCFLGGCMRIVVVSGTVFGTAEEVAWRASELLSAAGLDVAYQQHWQLQELLQQEPDALLLIASTTGMGELPERLQPLVDALQAQQPDWAGRPVGIIGLGDAGYGDNFAWQPMNWKLWPMSWGSSCCRILCGWMPAKA